MSDVELRLGTPADEPAIVALTRSLDLRLFSRLLLRAFGGPQARSTIVATRRGAVVGALRFGIGGREASRKASVVATSVATEGVLATVRSARSRAAAYSQRIKVPDGSFEVRDVFVDPHCRGEGIGSLLLDEAERRAKAAGAAQLALLVRADNPALRLYERHGYAVVEEEPGETASRLLMTKSVAR